MPAWGRKIGPLLLLGFAALGAFLWKGGFDLLPTERALVWKVPGEAASIRRLELQLYRGDTLLKREELSMPGGLTMEPTQKVVLGRGKYRARVLTWREGVAEPSAATAELEVTDVETVVVAPGP